MGNLADHFEYIDGDHGKAPISGKIQGQSQLMSEVDRIIRVPAEAVGAQGSRTISQRLQEAPDSLFIPNRRDRQRLLYTEVDTVMDNFDSTQVKRIGGEYDRPASNVAQGWNARPAKVKPLKPPIEGAGA